MISVSTRVQDEQGNGSDDLFVAPNEQGPSLELAIGWLLALVGFIVGSRTIGDNSFLTHLTTGDLIRVSGDVPRIDPYSFTSADQPWTVQSWFASLAYSSLADIGGGAAIRVFNGAMVSWVVAGLWKLSEQARPLIARLVLIGPVLVIGSDQWTPRPLLFGLLGFVIVAQVIQEQRSVRWLLPVMWVWANSHGSFPLGLVLIGAFGAGRMLDQRFSSSSGQDSGEPGSGSAWLFPVHEMRVMGWTLAGLGLAILNPMGPRLLVFPIRLLTNRKALDGVTEWGSPDFDSLTELMFLGLIVGLLVAARSGCRWRVLLPSIVFSIAGLLAVRNIGLAAVTILIAIAPSLHFRGTLRGHEGGLLPKALVGLAAVGLALSTMTVTRSSSLSLDLYPVAEIDWLEERGLIAEPDVNIIQRDFVGNYMHYRFGTEARVFVDDRFDFYPQQVLDDHLTLIRGGEFDEVLERYDANVVLWSSSDGFAAWLRASQEWTVAYEGEYWLIALPASS